MVDLVAGSLASGQQSGSSSIGSSSPTPQQQAVPNFGSTLTSLLDSSADLGDYVPCEFTLAQLRTLRPSPVADYLTAFEAEVLKKSVIAATLSPSNSGSFAPGGANAFANEIGSVSNLEGRTRSEALALVIGKLQPYLASGEKYAALARAEKSAAEKAATAGSLVSGPLAEYQQILSAAPVDNVSSSDVANKLLEVSDKFLLDFGQRINQAGGSLRGVQELAQEKTLEAQSATVRAQRAANDVQRATPKIGGEKVANAQLEALQETARIAANFATAKVQENLAAQQAAEQAASDLKAKQNALPQITAVVQDVKSTLLQTSQEQSKSGLAIVDSARNTIAAATRPLDVGCAMAILSWREVQVAFGRSVANEYIGVQVVVRNLNADKQFLIHDAELAVSADVNDRLGRFYSGRDQKIVRQISVSQQAASVRNLVVNILGAVGTVASAAMPFAGPSFKDATGVYNGGFLAALGKTWPDHSTDQLNLLNDVGFSASTENKAILVPKSGAAMFVMFVPSKQFKEGWWTQDCAHTLLTSAAQSQGSRGVGIDIDTAKTKCLATPPKPKAVSYSSWNPTADAIFRELAFAVVAGTHIAEQSSTKPTIASLDCKKDQLGNIDFMQQVNGSITCPLTGTNLDKVNKLKLRNAADATDNTTADGSVTVSGDTTKGNVDFPLAQIGPLQKPDYKVYAVAKDGTEDDAKQTLHLNVTTAYFVDVTEKATIALAAPKTGTTAQLTTIHLTGYHLDKIGKDDKIELRPNLGTGTLDFSFGNKTVSTASFDVAPSKHQATGDAKYELWYVPSGKDPLDLKLSVTFSGVLPEPPAASPAKPAAGL
jgi:hypothetical protein